MKTVRHVCLCAVYKPTAGRRYYYDNECNVRIRRLCLVSELNLTANCTTYQFWSAVGLSWVVCSLPGRLLPVLVTWWPVATHGSRATGRSGRPDHRVSSRATWPLTPFGSSGTSSPGCSRKTCEANEAPSTNLQSLWTHCNRFNNYVSRIMSVVFFLLALPENKLFKALWVRRKWDDVAVHYAFILIHSDSAKSVSWPAMRRLTGNTKTKSK